MGYVNVWCRVWFDNDGTFIGELVCDFVAGDSSMCSYILGNDFVWGPSTRWTMDVTRSLLGGGVGMLGVTCGYW